MMRYFSVTEGRTDKAILGVGFNEKDALKSIFLIEKEALKGS